MRILAEGRGMTVCGCLAFKPHTHERGHSSKPNGWILGHRQTVKNTDPGVKTFIINFNISLTIEYNFYTN